MSTIDHTPRYEVVSLGPGGATQLLACRYWQQAELFIAKQVERDVFRLTDRPASAYVVRRLSDGAVVTRAPKMLEVMSDV